MNVQASLGLALFLVVVYLGESTAKLTCFRKLRKNGKCAGIVRKGVFDSEEACCRKGAGFALKKMKVGKNRFRCTPCAQNEAMLLPVKKGKTKKVSKMKKEKKQKKPKKEKKVEPTAEPQTVAPIVEIKTKDSWFQPAKRTQISYTYEKPDEEKVRWGPWSPCSVTCGAGWRSRFKDCDDCDRNDYENVQSQPCMVKFYCPVDGNWGPWFPWQPCSQSCGGGFRIRQRKCNYPPPAYGGLNCPGKGVNNQTCNEQPCPVDGKWSTWTEFSLCSATCGHGVRRKARSCDSPSPRHGGKKCQGPATVTKKCQNTRCPQDGGWSLWGKWSRCEVSCGEGTRTRTRTCESPRPMYGGKDCEGVGKESLACYGGRPCPVDGSWSEWTNFGFCRAQRCEKGFQVRSRSCTEPRPLHGGQQCDGDQYERVECFNNHGCPRNGSWCEWSDWSKCTASCKLETALKVRQRECKCPSPKHGGEDCDGEGIAVMTCDDLPPCQPTEPVQRSDILAGNDDTTEHKGAADVLKESEADAEVDEDVAESGDGAEDSDQESDGDDYPDHTQMEGI